LLAHAPSSAKVAAKAAMSPRNFISIPPQASLLERSAYRTQLTLVRISSSSTPTPGLHSLRQCCVGKTSVECNFLANPRRSRGLLTFRLQFDFGNDEVFEWLKILVNFPAIAGTGYFVADSLEDLMPTKFEKR
jgi:hypothetical protein